MVTAGDSLSDRRSVSSLTCTAMGTCAAFVVMFPYLGRLWGIPGRSMVPLCLVLYLALVISLNGAFARAPKRLIAFNTLVILVSALVVLSASGVQFQYLASVSHWLHRPTDYYTAKLLVFIIGVIPPLLVMLSASFLNSQSRQDLMHGIAVGFVLIGILATIRLAVDWRSIFTSDFERAWSFLSRDPANGRDYSLVGFGAILATASAAALWRFAVDLRRTIITSVLCAIFLCGVFVVNQRSNLLFAGLAVLLVLFIQWLSGPHRRHVYVAASIIFLFTITFISTAANPAHIMYWGGFGQALQTRVDMAVVAFGYGNKEDTEGAEQEDTCLLNASGKTVCLSQLPTLDVPNVAANETPDSSEQPVIFDKDHAPSGLGSYFFIDQQLRYPHNIIAELWMEVGRFSAIIVSFLVFGWAYFAFIAAKRGDTASGAVVSAIGVILLLHSMKAGDLGFFGTMMFSLWLAFAFPTRSDVTLDS